MILVFASITENEAPEIRYFSPHIGKIHVKLGGKTIWQLLKLSHNEHKKIISQYPTYFSTRNPMVTLNLTLNITSKLQRTKIDFSYGDPNFLFQIWKEQKISCWILYFIFFKIVLGMLQLEKKNRERGPWNPVF